MSSIPQRSRASYSTTQILSMSRICSIPSSTYTPNRCIPSSMTRLKFCLLNSSLSVCIVLLRLEASITTALHRYFILSKSAQPVRSSPFIARTTQSWRLRHLRRFRARRRPACLRPSVRALASILLAQLRYSVRATISTLPLRSQPTCLQAFLLRPYFPALVLSIHRLSPCPWPHPPAPACRFTPIVPLFILRIQASPLDRLSTRHLCAPLPDVLLGHLKHPRRTPPPLPLKATLHFLLLR